MKLEDILAAVMNSGNAPTINIIVCEMSGDGANDDSMMGEEYTEFPGLTGGSGMPAAVPSDMSPGLLLGGM